MNNTTLIIGGILAISFLASLLFLARSVVARVTASIFTLGASAFCTFGFVASYELSASAALPWQIMYAILGVSSLITTAILLKGAFTKEDV
jgi:hypothetical protein